MLRGNSSSESSCSARRRRSGTRHQPGMGQVKPPREELALRQIPGGPVEDDHARVERGQLRRRDVAGTLVATIAATVAERSTQRSVSRRYMSPPLSPRPTSTSLTSRGPNRPCSITPGTPASQPARRCGLVHLADVVGDHAPVRARRGVAEPRGPERSQGRGDGRTAESSSGIGGADPVHGLGRVDDDDEPVGGRGDDLLAGVRSAAALDQPAVRRDLVGAVDREIEAVEAVERLDLEAERTRRGFGLGGGRDAADPKLACGERREADGRRSCRCRAPRPSRRRPARPRVAPRAASRPSTWLSAFTTRA